ncbi:MAG: Do family serine endopeptidase [Bacteroidia bacterium]|nr:Do family serine endopeptidase [Bacteroidia bacterium]
MFYNIKKTAAFILAATVAGYTGAYVFNKTNNKQAYTVAPATPVKFTSGNAALPTATDFTDAANRTVHGVVHIKTSYSMQQTAYSPFELFFGGGGGRQPQASTGSGVIISNDGYIVTNNHVVDAAEKVEVTLSDNKKYEGKVIGADPSTDLALIKIDAQNLPFIPFGNSDDVQVGQWVLAVGNPFNLTSTVTAGIVSAKGRNINILANNGSNVAPIESFIQTDAAVNPGNSGGALVNTNGELIGINSAIASNTGSYAGYSFAVPVNIARKVIDDFMEYGTIQRAYIGIQGRPVNSDLAEEKNLNISQGVYIDNVTEDGAAKEAGIKAGDVITKISNTTITDWPSMLEQVGRHRPGDAVVVAYLRNGKEYTTKVTLKNRSGNTAVVRNETISVMGAQLSPITNEDKSRLGIDTGVRVAEIGSGKLNAAGIRKNFIITSIDKQPVLTTSDVEAALTKSKNEGVLIEGVYPNGMRAWYGVGVGNKN